jgi:putative ABC transport system permease protein
MWNVTWKSIISHKLRLVMTSISIALGVALVSGALMLGATMNKTFDDMFSDAFRDWDAVVRSSTALSSDGFEQRPPIDQSVTATVRTVPGVTAVSEAVDGFAQITDKDGKPVSAGGPPQFGAAWDAVNPSPWKIVKGADPKADDEVVIDAALAKKAKLEVGDTTQVLTSRAPATVKIAGIAEFGSVDSPAGTQFVMFNGTGAAQKYIGEPGKLTSIFVRGEEGLSEQQLVDRLAPALGKDVEAVTGAVVTKENQDSLRSITGIISTVLTAFGGIALFVAAFIINNTFSIILAQRTKEMALLRAIGATRRQVLRSVMLEAFVTGVVASLVGLLLGILVSTGLQALLRGFGLDIPSDGLIIPSSAVITALVAGTVITVFSAYFPARRGSKTPPIAALREVAIDESNNSRSRLISGFALAALGVIAVGLGLNVDMDKPMIAVLAGAASIFIGVYLLGPIIARPASRVIGWPLPKIKGQTGHLARENAMRNPRRTSSTAAALMIGVALVTVGSVFMTSVKASLGQIVDRSFGGDFIVQSTNGMTGITPEVAASLKQRDEIATVSSLRGAVSKVDGDSVWLTAVNPAEFDKVMDLGVTDGDFAKISGDEIAVAKSFADSKNLVMGSTVQIELTTGTTTHRVAAIYNEDDLGGPVTVPLEAVRGVADAEYDQVVFVSKKANVASEQARKVVEEAAAPYLTAKVQDQTEFKQEVQSQIDQVLALFFVLLGLAIIIALFGIANTLALSVFERTRELGLLRAVGMTRRQVRSMIRWESVIVALLGTLLGIFIGTAMGAALVDAAKGEGIEVLSIPWFTLFVVLVIAAIAGILAAVFPARRGSRINVLQAIASD